MDNEARIILDDVISFCRRDNREQRLINMLEQCAATSFDESSLGIQVPSKFAYAYLLKQREIIEQYLEEITFMPTSLQVQVAGQAGDTAAHIPTTKPATLLQAQPADAPYYAAPQQTHPVNTSQELDVYASSKISSTSTCTPHTEDEHLPSIKDFVDASTPTPSPAPTPAHSIKTEAGSTPISVATTMSPNEFKKMMASMQEPKPQARSTKGLMPSMNTPANATAAEPEYPAVDINAKFTFESFVFGDENKHAYQSSLRFAAFADEPGQCTSLFIYGNSGLGKTHLLFAIKNYLSAEKPHLRVKYANSQAYFEDYLHDLSLQKGPGEPIMREYHTADILIIDDIQNILGKQATIEYFFQLVDEFIRSGKKIVIASDRAPKDLNLDERLTSRFNHGMLCLVSEPGFEMKYTILKRYYESIVCSSSDITDMNVDTSLLSSLQITEGHLTDEQLRHMAEISGNNIRNLESFCERCASRSAEREAEGHELSAEDIDAIAEQYFTTAHKIIHVNTVQRVVEEYYRVSHEDLIGPRRTANIAWARHVAVYLANSLCEMTTPAIGAEFGGRDHSTVLNSLKVVENKMKSSRQNFEDIQTLKNKIILKS